MEIILEAHMCKIGSGHKGEVNESAGLCISGIGGIGWHGPGVGGEFFGPGKRLARRAPLGGHGVAEHPGRRRRFQKVSPKSLKNVIVH